MNINRNELKNFIFSLCSTMSVFNALMVGLMEEDDYQLSTFSLIHPGGAVGKRIC